MLLAGRSKRTQAADIKVARQRAAGLSRESLYEALSGERSPDFDTSLKVMGAPSG